MITLTVLLAAALLAMTIILIVILTGGITGFMIVADIGVAILIVYLIIKIFSRK